MDKVLEISIEETNALRLKLGLKPLRTSREAPSAPAATEAAAASSGNPELNLSINESNALRQKLGLAPLRSTSNAGEGKSARTAIHAPPPTTSKEEEVKKRLEAQKLKRKVQAGIQALKDEEKAEKSSKASAKDWAQQMLASKSKQPQAKGLPKEAKKQSYNSSEFDGQNLHVTHAASELEANQTTVLTLADVDLTAANQDDNQLENVNLTEGAYIQDNLREKRKAELGAGSAGGYAGYDDDEFEELGGSQRPGRGIKSDEAGSQRKGFALSQVVEGTLKNTQASLGKSDLFASEDGRAISLSTSSQKAETDFMTLEEEESNVALMGGLTKEELEKKRKKKEKKLKKKMKKMKKSKLSKEEKDMERDGSDEKEPHNSKEKSSLLNDLEGMSAADTKRRKRQKRRRTAESSDEESDEEKTTIAFKGTNNRMVTGSKGVSSESLRQKEVKEDEDEQRIKKRKAKFNEIMEKGNERTKAAFQKGKMDTSIGDGKTAKRIDNESHVKEEEADDAILDAALSKAKRLQRLRKLQKKTAGKKEADGAKRGADAVVQAIRSMPVQQNDATMDQKTNANGNTSRISFEIDATKEFTRALRAKATQTVPELESKPPAPELESKPPAPVSTETIVQENTKTVKSEIEPMEVETVNTKEENDQHEGESLAELSKRIEPDTEQAFGTTGSTVGVGRGLSNVLSMLKSTGEISKSAAREELRGRSKDARTYEDYEALDLKKVVRLDTSGMSGNVHAKDLEFANREIKLEWRDEHGRLLTRKEAYRNLCYQFHGHGSSKKNEERKLKQIERERAERSNAAKQVGGTGVGDGANDKDRDRNSTLGALKATQRATGKAFVLHKY